MAEQYTPVIQHPRLRIARWSFRYEKNLKWSERSNARVIPYGD